MQVRDEARDRVRVGGCDVALVLRCVLCVLSFYWSTFLFLKGFIVGIGVRKKLWVTHVVRSPSWTCSS